MADDVLHSGVRGVTDLMVMPGLINLDFADIRAVMSEMGKAMMGTGEAEGDRRAIDAAEAAISNPLLEDVSMKGARGVLINITGGIDMTLFEVDEAANRIREEVDPEANIIFGSTFDEKLAGRMRISVVATGIDADREAARPRLIAGARTASRDGGPSRQRSAECARPRAQPIDAPSRPPRAETRRPSRAPAGRPRRIEPAPRVARGRLHAAARRSSRAGRPAPTAAAAVAPDPLAAARWRMAARPGEERRPRAEPVRARHRRRPPAHRRRARPRRAAADGPPRPAQPRLGAARSAAIVRSAQGGGPARHSGLPAPPGELTPAAIRLAGRSGIQLLLPPAVRRPTFVRA